MPGELTIAMQDELRLKELILRVLREDGASWDSTELVDFLRRGNVSAHAHTVSQILRRLHAQGPLTVELGDARKRYPAVP